MSILNERQIRRIIREEIEDILDEIEDEESTIDEANELDDSSIDEYIMDYFVNVNWNRFNSEVSKLVGEPVKWDEDVDISNNNEVIYISKDEDSIDEYWVDIYGKVYGASGRGGTEEYGIIKGFKSYDEWSKSQQRRKINKYTDKYLEDKTGIIKATGISNEDLIKKYPWLLKFGNSTYSNMVVEYVNNELYIIGGEFSPRKNQWEETTAIKGVLFKHNKREKPLYLHGVRLKDCTIIDAKEVSACILDNCVVKNSDLENCVVYSNCILTNSVNNITGFYHHTILAQQYEPLKK